MNNPIDEFDKDLEELLAKRKSRFTAPHSVKHKVMLRARQKIKDTGSHWMSGMLAAAASLLIVFGLLEYSHYSNEPQDHYTQVNYHKMNDEAVASFSERFEVVRKEYSIANLRMSGVYKKQVAMVSSLDNGLLELITCDSTKVTLSQSLLQQLEEMARVKPDLKIGDKVMLATNQDGYILNIDKGEHSAKTCD